MRSVLLAFAGGTVGGVIVWLVARAALNKELESGAVALSRELGSGRGELEARLARGRAELSNQIKLEVNATVPPLVRAEMIRTLGQYGITPQTGQRIDAALRAAERLGWL